MYALAQEKRDKVWKQTKIMRNTGEKKKNTLYTCFHENWGKKERIFLLFVFSSLLFNKCGTKTMTLFFLFGSLIFAIASWYGIEKECITFSSVWLQFIDPVRKLFGNFSVKFDFSFYFFRKKKRKRSFFLLLLSSKLHEPSPSHPSTYTCVWNLISLRRAFTEFYVDILRPFFSSSFSLSWFGFYVQFFAALFPEQQKLRSILNEDDQKKKKIILKSIARGTFFLFMEKLVCSYRIYSKKKI